MPLDPGHCHHRSLTVPIGFVFISIVDMGEPVECLGRTFYKANGNNGTHNLIGKFPRMTNAPTTTGGSDSHTLTVNEMPNHSHRIATSGAIVQAGGNYYATGQFNTQSEAVGGGAAHENRPAFIELIPYEAVS